MDHLVPRSHCFMVFHKDQFLVPCSLTDICNSADDTVIFACDKNLNNVIAGLENDSSIITQWLADNLMKLNTDKFNLFIVGRNPFQQVTINIGDALIEKSEATRRFDIT